MATNFEEEKMIQNRSLIFTCFVLAVLPAAAQQPPAPPAVPVVPVAPVPPVAPEPPVPPEPFIDLDFSQVIQDATRIAAEAAQFKVDAKLTQNLGALFQRNIKFSTTNQDDRLYEQGQRELDRGQWNAALTNFTQVASRGGSRADGALYWKAYALNKLGRRDESLAAIAELRKSYASSRWLDDANALEMEVKQSTGQAVSPEDQPDEELKLMALNALVNTDPDRALPILDNLLKSSQSLRLKERALFVLAQSSSPRGQQVLEQFAKGGANPDLQLKAIQYLGVVNRQDHVQVLSSIYSSSNDPNIKRAAINALALQPSNAKVLVDLARKEQDAQMKIEIVRRLSQWAKSSKEASDYMLEILK